MTHPPLLTFAQAGEIGEKLHDRWEAMTGGEVPFAREDMAWADLVQFVVRMAREVGEGGDGR